jgi:hypothetical protein
MRLAAFAFNTDRVRLLLESGAGLENPPKFLSEGNRVSEKKLI